MRQDVWRRIQTLLLDGADLEGSAAAHELDEVMSAYTNVR